MPDEIRYTAHVLAVGTDVAKTGTLGITLGLWILETNTRVRHTIWGNGCKIVLEKFGCNTDRPVEDLRKTITGRYLSVSMKTEEYQGKQQTKINYIDPICTLKPEHQTALVSMLKGQPLPQQSSSSDY